VSAVGWFFCGFGTGAVVMTFIILLFLWGMALNFKSKALKKEMAERKLGDVLKGRP
jgi:hypothetical protein